MKLILALLVLVVCLIPVSSFFHAKSTSGRTGLRMSTVEETIIPKLRSVESPDFYWKYRLERLVSKKGGQFAYDTKNYPDAVGYKELYDSYYLDLTLQGKLKGFNWMEEKNISDGEWFSIYKSISDWTVEETKIQAETNKIPINDFDLLKQFYPELNYRDLDVKFDVSEVGDNFPYKNMKELVFASQNGKLDAKGFTVTGPNLEATQARKELEALKEKALAKVDAAYEKVMKYVQQPFPDEESKKHYQSILQTLSEQPQSSAEWAVKRELFEREIDDMARFASRKVEHHDHHEGEGEHLSPAQEFEQKYGMNLDELQDTFNKYKADPVAYFDSVIVSIGGREALDIWRKSQQFAAEYDTLSPAERTAAESKYLEFLKKA